MQKENTFNDPLRQKTQACPYRKNSGFGFFERNYKCTHPAAVGEHPNIDYRTEEATPSQDKGYETFCEIVDTHLVNIGKRSRFIIDGTYREVTGRNLLPPPEE